MTAQEIADRLVQDPNKGITAGRVRKLLKLCERSGVALSDVLALLPADVRQQIAEAA